MNTSLASEPTASSLPLSHLGYIESKIEPQLLLQFEETAARQHDWEGEITAGRLFDLWQEAKNDAVTAAQSFSEDTDTPTTQNNPRRRLARSVKKLIVLQNVTKNTNFSLAMGGTWTRQVLQPSKNQIESWLAKGSNK